MATDALARVNFRMANDLLADRVIEAIKAASLTIGEATEMAGCDRDYITQLRKERNGKAQDPGVKRLKRLAEVTRVPATWLIDAIDPDDAERARGVRWPPIQAQINGNLSKETEGQALLDIWFTLDRPLRNAALMLIEAASRAAPRKIG